jgi:hypothetical protein
MGNVMVGPRNLEVGWTDKGQPRRRPANPREWHKEPATKELREVLEACENVVKPAGSTAPSPHDVYDIALAGLEFSCGA